MRYARWPVLLLAAVAGCADGVTPTDLESPSLAKPGASGVRILDLGTLGGNQSYAAGLNTPTTGNRLLIVGRNQGSTGAPVAAYWLVDVATLQVEKNFLPPLDASHQGFAWDANPSEEIIGWSSFTNPDGTYAGTRATRWSRAGTTWTPSLIPTLDASSRHDAAGINAAGLIVGGSPNAAGDEHVYLFDGTTTIDRGGLGGKSEAHDVNMLGTIVGATATGSGTFQRAFISYPDTPPALLPDYGNRSGARAINDDGIIVGYALTAAGASRAVRWTRSPVTGEYVIEDLGLTNARAWDVNNAGEIVGSFVGRQGERAFFRSANGATKELPVLTYAAIAYAINERAEVTGISYYRNAYSHAVLWTNVR